MRARLRGLLAVVIGVGLAVPGYGLALAILREPLPDWWGLRDLAPYLAQIARAGAPEPGLRGLLLADFGLMALGAMALGGIAVLGGLWQIVTGRNSLYGVLVALLCVGGAAFFFLFT